MSALTASLMAEGEESVGVRSPVRSKAPSLEDFEVLYTIGRGLVGQVYLVRHTALGETYAMKVIPKAFVVEANMVAHAAAEAHILKSVSHPFVVRLVFSFQTPDSLVLIMEFMHGGDMAYLLRRRIMLREDEVVFYAAEIAEALVFLHNESIVHRDLKTGNILLDIEGHVRLTDFGFAKVLEPSNGATTTHTYCGTGAYMAPEIMAQDKGYGMAADWWSFGVVLYEMLTGGKPFGLASAGPGGEGPEQEDARVSARLAAINEGDLVFPDFPVLSEHARDLLTQLLDPNPATRLSGEDVMDHPFFADVDWDAVVNLEMEPPWEPYIEYSDEEDEYIECFPSSLTESTPVLLGVLDGGASNTTTTSGSPSKSPASRLRASSVATLPAFSYTSPSTASALGLQLSPSSAAPGIPEYNPAPVQYRSAHGDQDDHDDHDANDSDLVPSDSVGMVRGGGRGRAESDAPLFVMSPP